jgi:hypothetical protein
MQQLATRVINSPRAKLSLSLWGLGLALLFLIPGLPVSKRQLDDYHKALPPSGDIAAEQEAHSAFLLSNRRYEESMGWFWSCDANCQALKRDMTYNRAAYDKARARVQGAATRARGHLGLWSTHGVEAAKGAFWASFNNAMAVAKNASWWDFIFYGIRAQFRDEGLGEFLMRMLFRIVRAHAHPTPRRRARPLTLALTAAPGSSPISPSRCCLACCASFGRLSTSFATTTRALLAALRSLRCA